MKILPSDLFLFGQIEIITNIYNNLPKLFAECCNENGDKLKLNSQREDGMHCRKQNGIYEYLSKGDLGSDQLLEGNELEL